MVWPRDNTAFTNSARSDGLQLRHWRKQKPARVANTDAMDTETGEVPAQPDYEFAKYNISITVPTYTDEQYEAHLKSSEWSREETDYLVQTVKDWHQNWTIIIDRYEYILETKAEDATNPSTALVKAQEVKERTLENLKARYYEIWAKIMAVESGGVQNMNETEFHLHETLTRYNPQTETVRKNLAWQLTSRSAEEIREEEYLLSELQRIMISAGKFEAERAEVRQRLESAQSQSNDRYGNNGTLNFAVLNQLYNSLAAQDRSRKARHRLSLNNSDLIHSPSGMGPNGTPLTANNRDSLGSAGGPNRKSSMAAPQPVRHLPPRLEKKFAITTHERLSSGVTFRSDRLLKLRQAKSQIQTQKIAAALAELGVPDIINLPTQRVLDAFDHLVQRVTKLLDARKVVEKEESEFRVQAAMRDELKQPEGAGGDGVKEEGDTTINGADDEQDGQDQDAEGEEEDDSEGEDDNDEDADGDGDGDGDDDADGDEDGDADGDEDAEGEEEDDVVDQMEVEEPPPVRPSSSRSVANSATRSHKRSASVLSTNSNASKRSRRLR
jgi:DNA methyltransferase 1-associated protein 1